jgi:RNA polymerase sigma-70 factor (ECF subfamily)
MNGDAELVSRIKEGDLVAFEALYDKYKGQIYRTALAITHQREAAEEILQDCFLRAYRHIHKVNSEAHLSPWLHRIAINLAHNWIARERPWASLEEFVDWLTVSPRLSPERIVEEKELQDVVQQAVDSLEFRQRAVVILFYLQGFNLTEIAYVLDCPVGTVKSRLYHARENLRRKLMGDERVSRGVAYEYT